MRAGLDGVSTARYFKRNPQKLNKRDTVFTTIATVAKRERVGEPFYTYTTHVIQLLNAQGIYRSIGPHDFTQAFRDCKMLGQIEQIDEGYWKWCIDPRPYSALEADHKEYRAEQGLTEAYEANRAQDEEKGA